MKPSLKPIGIRTGALLTNTTLIAFMFLTESQEHIIQGALTHAPLCDHTFGLKPCDLGKNHTQIDSMLRINPNSNIPLDPPCTQTSPASSPQTPSGYRSAPSRTPPRPESPRRTRTTAGSPYPSPRTPSLTFRTCSSGAPGSRSTAARHSSESKCANTTRPPPPSSASSTESSSASASA